MSNKQKVRALALRMAGLTQRLVAAKVWLSVKTIRRLEQAAVGMNEVRWGTTEKMRIWKKEKGRECHPDNSVKESQDHMHTVTDMYAKDTGPLVEEGGQHHHQWGAPLHRKSSVVASKPFLTEFQIERKLAFATGYHYWGKGRVQKPQ